MAAGRRFPLQLIERAQIICKTAEGLLSQDSARALHISRPTVRLWRQRFLALRLPGLEKDAPRSGHIPRVSHRKVQAVVHATLHTTPLATHWSARSMAKAQGPEQRHHSPDLEAAQPETSLDRNLQAQPLLPLRPGVPARHTHDYKRDGTTTLFAALNMLDGTVIGDCMPRHYFIPTSSSWPTIVEHWFRQITDKRIGRGSFKNAADVIAVINHYIQPFNQNPQVVSGVHLWSES
jgi:hypothetical protein